MVVPGEAPVQWPGHNELQSPEAWIEEQAKAGQDIRDAGGAGTPPHTPHAIHRDSGPLLDYQGR